LYPQPLPTKAIDKRKQTRARRFFIQVLLTAYVTNGC
jgi:hypothetical protein